jgi:hypothetical protein
MRLAKMPSHYGKGIPKTDEFILLNRKKCNAAGRIRYSCIALLIPHSNPLSSASPRSLPIAL